MKNTKIDTTSQLSVLVVLRLLIGWHLLYEGISKLIAFEVFKKPTFDKQKRDRIIEELGLENINNTKRRNSYRQRKAI